MASDVVQSKIQTGSLTSSPSRVLFLGFLAQIHPNPSVFSFQEDMALVKETLTIAQDL